MLEIGKCCCGLQLGVDGHWRGDRFDLIVNGRQLLVLDLDGSQRFERDVVGGQNYRNRLSIVSHFVKRENRLVVKGWSMIGVGKSATGCLDW